MGSSLRKPESKRAGFFVRWMGYNIESTGRKLSGTVHLLISGLGRLVRASRSRAAGRTFFVRSCPDQLLSERPIETLIRQCAYLALLFVSGATALHLSPRQANSFCSPPRHKVARMRGGMSHNHSGQWRKAGHFRASARPLYSCRT